MSSPSRVTQESMNMNNCLINNKRVQGWSKLSQNGSKGFVLYCNWVDTAAIQKIMDEKFRILVHFIVRINS